MADDVVLTPLDASVGGTIGWGPYNKMLPEEPSLVAYAARIAERPANQKAGAMTFGGAFQLRPGRARAPSWA